MANDIINLDVKIAFKFKQPKESFANKLICWWTKSKYYHVELVLGDKWISSNPDVGGVTINDLRPLQDNYEYLELKDVRVTKEQYTRIMQWIDSQKDKAYDWVAIFMCCVLHLNWHSKNKWFCSEICTTILKFLLVKEVMNFEPNNTTPGDLSRIFGME